jgi:lipoprotein NlpD
MKFGKGRMTAESSALWWLPALVLFVLVLAGCGTGGPAPVYDGYGPAPEGYYRIRKGDTLAKIARRHGVGYHTLANWNNLSPPYRIYAGKLLRVVPQGGKRGPSSSHGSSATASAARSKSTSGVGAKPPPGASNGNARVSAQAGPGLRWTWPLKGKVVQRFRSGDRTRQGVRIAGGEGQQVCAAESGTVVYSGSGLKGYGNLIIVKHNDIYLSAYGFNRRLLVNEGAQVRRGQVVAEVGNAANGKYRLHFEIRKNGSAVDPLKYLP